MSAPAPCEGGAQYVRLNTRYLSALENARLVPVVVPPLRDEPSAATVLAAAGGLLLTGGADIAPELYGEPRHPMLGAVDAERDAWEISLVVEARRLALPVLAICRGIQLLNVALGGALVQDIPAECNTSIDHYPSVSRATRTHDVELAAGSRAASALRAERLSVNSLHHQAVSRVASSLRVTGRAPDGIIEALESEGDWWVLAVQWHPEELDRERDPRVATSAPGLFESFASAVQAYPRR